MSGVRRGLRKGVSVRTLWICALAGAVCAPPEASASSVTIGHARAGSALHAGEADLKAPIPAFARLFGTACSTCHTAAPKLNVLGEAFRLNGYRLPSSELLVRHDDPVDLGAPPWRDQWPRAIWPSDLPGISTLALRLQTDLVASRDATGASNVDYDFPHEVYILAAAPLGDAVSVFFESEWEPGEELEIVQAKIAFRDPIPGLPEGALNLWVGRLNPFLLSFTDRQIDRAGVVGPAWQSFRLEDLGVEDRLGSPVSASGHELGGGHESIELSGVAGGRLHYALGLSRGAATEDGRDNGHKDPYYRVRYKLGGMNLNGQYSPGGGPVLGSGGQLLDRALILEHFGYFGNESTAESPQGSHRATGFAARVLHGRLDAGVGWVRRTYRTPFGTASGRLSASNWFAKAEHLVYPWLIASLKLDALDVEATSGALDGGIFLPDADRRRVSPGLVMLIRQNVRAVAEARFYLDGDAAVGLERPLDFVLRLDLSF